MLSLYLSAHITEQERDKFEELYKRYKKTVHYIALEYMNDPYLAEDATHETFLKLTNYVNRIGEVDSPKTYSFVAITARSVCIDMLRSEKSYLKNTEKFHSKSVGEQTAGELLEKIKVLPEIYRDVLILKYYMDMPNSKIAEIMNLNEPAVRKRLQRARELLNEVIA